MNEKQLFFLWVIICLITHLIRLSYEIFKSRKIILPGKLSFIIILINMTLLWMSWFELCRLDFYQLNLPDVVRFSGILMFSLGVLVFFISLFTIKSLESYEGDLITRGIYSKIRHPMYLGFIMWLIGLPVFFESLFSMFLSILFISNVLFWRHLEEMELLKRFPEYREYKKSTIF
ncbi:MAG TPA: methyltransferase [Cyclobacteriaceae bacterium]|nr:methyltransferase [Cyclobacteriaceae bacterium]